MNISHANARNTYVQTRQISHNYNNVLIGYQAVSERRRCPVCTRERLIKLRLAY